MERDPLTTFVVTASGMRVSGLPWAVSVELEEVDVLGVWMNRTFLRQSQAKLVLILKQV